MNDEKTPVEELEGEDLDWAVFDALKFRTADDDHVYPPDDYGRAICHIDDWAPSEDIRQAWEVVEATDMFRDDVRLPAYYPQMDKTTERAVFLHQHDDRDGAYWCVAFYDPGGGCGGSYAKGSTPPEAICRAAVRWARDDHREER